MNRYSIAAASALLFAAFNTGAYAAGGEIAVIVKTVNSNYWQNVQKGASAAVADAKGYTLTFQGPASESAITDEVNMVVNAVNRRVADSAPEANFSARRSRHVHFLSGSGRNVRWRVTRACRS